jgi:hypothetical protein
LEYGTFKMLQFVLFFAPVFIFGFWQLAALRRLEGERRARKEAQGADHDDGKRPPTGPV